MLHITPGITENWLFSTSKFAATNYTTFVDKEAVNIYNPNNTTITVTWGAILSGWKDAKSDLWPIPLLNVV
jgi:hypothetical protein